MKKNHMNTEAAELIGKAVEHATGLGLYLPRDIGLVVLSDLDKQGFKVVKKPQKKAQP